MDYNKYCMTGCFQPEDGGSGEAGESPARSRHCEEGVPFQPDYRRRPVTETIHEVWIGASRQSAGPNAPSAGGGVFVCRQSL